MQGKFFLIFLTIMFSQHSASSHVLTSKFLDMSLPTCMRLLTYTMMNDFCPTYGTYSDNSSEAYNKQPMPRELSARKWENRESVAIKCCTKPCTLTELLSIC